MNILTGVARCLKDTNIIAQHEASLRQKPTVMLGIGHLPTPTIVSGYRYLNQPTWCDFGQKCENGAILPKIVQNYQKNYLPPKTRLNAPDTGLGLVTLS